MEHVIPSVTRHSRPSTIILAPPPPVIPASPPTVIPASFQRESSIFVPSATRSNQHHSPLEGESARQGRSPPTSRWGDVVPRMGVIDSERGGSSADIPVPHPSSLIHLLSLTPAFAGAGSRPSPEEREKKDDPLLGKEEGRREWSHCKWQRSRGTWLRSKCASAGRTCEAARRDRQDGHVRRVRGQTTTSGFRPQCS